MGARYLPASRNKMRLDQALVDRGFAPSRAQARDAIKRGLVLIGHKVCLKPAYQINSDADIQFTQTLSPYVSRGGLKLAHALDNFSIGVDGKTAIDLGSSTGGFTDVLLQNGACKIFAVDVGKGQLHDKLRRDTRVHILENMNAKDLSSEYICEQVDLIVCDVSFISLAKALPASLSLTKDKAQLIALIKPQFEVGPEHVGKGGIVRDALKRQQAIDDISTWMGSKPGWEIMGVCPSPIKGPDGNEEYLLYALKR